MSAAMPALVVIDSGDWPDPALLLRPFAGGAVTGADLWFERLCRAPGSGLLNDGGEWASGAVRRRYDLEQWPQRGHRCGTCLSALPPGHGRFCGPGHRAYRYRTGWQHRAAFVLCPVDGVPVWSATARTARPNPACPRLPGDPDPAPSQCESAYARALARTRQARRRERLLAAPDRIAAPAVRAILPAADPLGDLLDSWALQPPSPRLG